MTATTAPPRRRRFDPDSALLPVAAVALALVVGAVIIAIDGTNPLSAYAALLEGAFGGQENLGRTLEKATPLILSGLAVTVGLKAGLFNIGAQGQLLLGAIFSAYVGWQVTGLPAVLHVPLCLLVGATFGAVPAVVAGVLKAWRGAHEVIVTIMLNAILVNLTDWLAGEPWQEPGQAISRTPPIEDSAVIPRVAELPIGFFLAVALAVAMWFVIERTTFGFRLRTVGANRNAAHYAGISVRWITVAAMAVSGALAGLGGAIETQGVIGRYEPGFNASLGFDGITIALLAKAQPRSTIPAAFLVAILRAGSSRMQAQTQVEPEIIDVLLAVILLLVAAPVVLRTVLRRRADRHGDQLRLTAGWGS
jgi:ABC-type uncharacterized transport system permease subunit